MVRYSNRVNPKSSCALSGPLIRLNPFTLTVHLLPSKAGEQSERSDRPGGDEQVSRAEGGGGARRIALKIDLFGLRLRKQRSPWIRTDKKISKDTNEKGQARRRDSRGGKGGAGGPRRRNGLSQRQRVSAGT